MGSTEGVGIMKDFIMFDRCKDPENRSKKGCLCGGHSHKDVKKNLHHNSTKMKYYYHLRRLFKLKNLEV